MGFFVLWDVCEYNGGVYFGFSNHHMSGTDLLKNPELRSNKVNLFDLFAGKSKETLSTMQESLG